MSKKKIEIINLESALDYSTPPLSRYGHSSIIIKKKIFFFGGVESNNLKGKFYNTLHVFNIEKDKWSNISFSPQSEAKISGRHFHTCVYNSKTNCIYIFGGKSNGYKNDIIVVLFSKDISEIDFCAVKSRDYVSFKKIESKETKGDVPSPMYGHSAFVHGNPLKMYVFGGYDNNGFCHNRLVSFDFKTLEWKKIKLENNLITRRYHHSGILFIKDKYYIINGLQGSNKALCDMWMIDLKSWKVKQVKTKNKKVVAKSYGNSCFLFNKKMFCYGGRTIKDDVKFVCCFDHKTSSWEKIDFPFRKEMHSSYCTIDVFENKMFFFGGQTKGKKKVVKKIKVKNEKKVKSIEELPVEVMKIIISYLDVSKDAKTFLSISSLSKKSFFSKLVKDDENIWKEQFHQATHFKSDNGKWVLSYIYEKIASSFWKAVKRERTFRKQFLMIKEREHKIRKKIKENSRLYDPFIEKPVKDYEESYFDGKELKCVVVGNAGVGKSSLICLLEDEKYPQYYVPTIADKSTIEVNFRDEKIKIGFWDVNSSEDMENLRPYSYVNTNVFLLSFAVDDKHTLERCVKYWYPEIKKSQPDVPIVLCGYRCDRKYDNDFLEEFKQEELNFAFNRKEFKFIKDDYFVTEKEITEAIKSIKADAYIETSSFFNFNTSPQTLGKLLIKVIFNEPKQKKKCLIM